MKKLLIIISLLVVLSIVGGILYFSKTKTVDVIHLPTRQYTLVVAPIVYEHASSTYAEMSLSYPKSDSTNLPEIASFISKTKNDFWSQYGSLTIEEAKSLYIRDDNQYQMYIDTRVATSSKTVSYLISVYQYTGGAHGGTDIYSFTYDNRGKLIKIDDVFNPNFLSIVAPLAKQYFSDTLGEYSQPDAIDSGTEAISSNYSVWYLTPDTVTFVFGQYQVGAYALGIQEFPIEKSKIQDILQNGYK